MMPYLMTFSSYSSSFSEATQRRVLEVVDAVAGIFPLQLQVTEREMRVLESPGDYQRADVPEIYRIDGDCFRIPLYSPSADAEVFFVESSEPSRFPVQFQLAAASLEKARISPLPVLLDLAEQVLAAFPMSDFFLCDQEQLGEEMYSERICSLDLSQVPLGVFWVNLFSTAHLRNLGNKAQDTIQRMAAAYRTLPSGLLFATQDHSFRIGVPEDEARLKEMESALGFETLRKRFPVAR